MAKRYGKTNSHWTTFGLVTVVAVIFSLLVTVNLTQQQTNTQSQAANKRNNNTKRVQKDTVGNVILDGSDAGCSLTLRTSIYNRHNDRKQFEYRYRLYKNGELFNSSKKLHKTLKPGGSAGIGTIYGMFTDDQLESGSYYAEILVSPSLKKIYKTDTEVLTNCS